MPESIPTGELVGIGLALTRAISKAHPCCYENFDDSREWVRSA
jgi:hypothetical protein